MLRFFNLPCDVDLQVMRPAQSLAALSARLLTGLDDVLKESRPELVIAQGDTTTAFVAGLCAYYHQIPLAHVEAGLRSHDRYAPFPEEVNRRLLDDLTDWLFAPTLGAQNNLLREGHDPQRIFVTGNTGIDALYLARRLLQREDAERIPQLSHLPPGSKLALLTTHRRESFGQGLLRTFRAVARLCQQVPELHVLCPVHPNPNVAEAAQRELGPLPQVHLCEPLSYPDFVSALCRADLILTDSGGIQEEAPALGKYVLVLRDTTERPEGVAAGVAELVGTDEDRIVESSLRALKRGERPEVSPYGDGRATMRIVEVLKTGRLTTPFDPTPG